ncbi:MAG: IS200/IS605 family transposase [Lentisphaerae bacterium]|jgi:putative transposase|nr:IS200/IS605 family transposase [Lentisphaerota bacterium]MBT5604956.1 IS200/IS605 family transposase [Lentisphaerota bacterium]MBT7056450.1 IS200/IS605 family transposase [Lentisphaerota bacterium]MBT7844997.1 IS200/IS605 family transposase [Lentisphaerota bacterium]
MSRFRELTHTIWHCQYHIVWVPKYRYRVLVGPVGREASECIGVLTAQAGGEVVELNVQRDHVHLVGLIPPKVSVSYCVGLGKGSSVSQRDGLSMALGNTCGALGGQEGNGIPLKLCS